MTSATFKSEDLWVVVAAYDEAGVIASVVKGLCRLYRNVVIVDDGSSDETWREALDAKATVLRHPVNLGQGAALQTAITYALGCGARYVATFDADGQHDPHDIGRLFEALKEANADVALGSRFLGQTVGMDWKRRLVLKAAVQFSRLTTGLKLTDAHNGLRVFTAEAIGKFELQQNRMAHASEILEAIARFNLHFIEVPCTIVYTDYSKRKGQRSSDSINIITQLFVGRLRK